MPGTLWAVPAANTGSKSAIRTSGMNVMTITGIGSRSRMRHSWRTIARLSMRPPPPGQREERALEGRADDLDRAQSLRVRAQQADGGGGQRGRAIAVRPQGVVRDLGPGG